MKSEYVANKELQVKHDEADRVMNERKPLRADAKPTDAVYADPNDTTTWALV